MTKSQEAEFLNIARNQPVFAGHLQSHQGASELMDLGLVTRADGKYVLTDKGTEIKLKMNING